MFLKTSAGYREKYLPVAGGTSSDRFDHEAIMMIEGRKGRS
jgi:hypothetical protein